MMRRPADERCWWVAEIEKISCYKYKGSLKPEMEQVSCVICISEFELKQTLRVLPCSHEFHAKCIDKWLKVSTSLRSCLQRALVKRTFAEQQNLPHLPM